MVHVPNKGMNPALIDLMGGQVQVLFASVPAMMTEKSERVRPIAMAESEALGADAGPADHGRIRLAGLRRRQLGGPARARRPRPARSCKKLHDEVIAILDTPDMKERVKTLGFDLIASTPEEFAPTHERRRALGRGREARDVRRSRDKARLAQVRSLSHWEREHIAALTNLIHPVERRLVAHQHALDVLPGRAEQERRGLPRDAGDVRRQQQPLRGLAGRASAADCRRAGGSVE